MKRTGSLFERIADYDNLRLATAQALRGKRHRPDARQFVHDLDANLQRIRCELLSGVLPLGNYRQFVIHDPKQRIITAPCFRERVLHHAVMHVCEPEFERRLIDDTFACRRGKGRVVAVERAAGLSRRFAYYLKLDVRKYFDSVPHDRLLQRLAGCFKDPQLLDLFARILAAFRGPLACGLPIGSLTSQHFANFYLGRFDRYIKEQQRLKGYVRYMDDMILWADTRTRLRELLVESAAFLQNDLELQMKTPHLNRMRHGVDFLGCRIYHNRVTLNGRSRRRFARSLRRLERQHALGQLTELQLQQRVTAITAFTQTHGIESWHFRHQLLQQLAVSGPKARTG